MDVWAAWWFYSKSIFFHELFAGKGQKKWFGCFKANCRLDVLHEASSSRNFQLWAGLNRAHAERSNLDTSDSQRNKSQTHVVHQTSISVSQMKNCRYSVSSTHIMLPLSLLSCCILCRNKYRPKASRVSVCAVVIKEGGFILAAYRRIKAAVACGCTRSQAFVPCESDQSVRPAGPSLSLTPTKV